MNYNSKEVQRNYVKLSGINVFSLNLKEVGCNLPKKLLYFRLKVNWGSWEPRIAFLTKHVWHTIFISKKWDLSIGSQENEIAGNTWNLQNILGNWKILVYKFRASKVYFIYKRRLKLQSDPKWIVLSIIHQKLFCLDQNIN